MYKDGVITISDWQKGVGESPYLGFAHIRNGEVFETPGILKIASSVEDASGGTTYTGLVVATAKDPYGGIYHLTDDGKCYKNYSTVLQSGLGTSYDILIHKDYLFVRHSTVISLYGPLSGAASWIGNWKTGFDGDYYGKMVVAEDPDASLGSEAIYVANGATIKKITSFTAGSPPTATVGTGLTLPDAVAAVTLEPVGNYIIVGTQAKTGSWSTRTNQKVANLYPWDKSSLNSFNLPVKLNEASVHAMVADNNKLYVVAGALGNVYVTDTTNYIKIKTLPWVQSRGFNQTTQTYPNAISFNAKANLLIGTSTLSDAGNVGTTQESTHGIFEIDLHTEGYPTVLKYIPEATGGGVVTRIGSILTSASDIISYSWQRGTEYGIYETNFRASSCFAESGLIRVGDRLNRRAFEKIQFSLGFPLAGDVANPTLDGQAVDLYYRKTLADDYTLVGNYTYKDLGSIISHVDSAVINKAEQLQFKVVLSQTSGVLSTNNLSLIDVKLW